MVIEIKDFPNNVKRVILEFDDSENEPKTILESNSNTTKQKSSKKTNQKETENDEIENSKPLDLDFCSTPVQVSQEIVKKPEIKEVKRETKISNTMQNLKI